MLHEFKAKNGMEVILRTLRWDDIDDFVELFNSLVETKADIITDTKVTREDEAEWIAGKLLRLVRNESIDIVAEIGGRVVANCWLDINKGISSHTGDVGIIVRSDYQNIGVGTEMLKTIIKQAKEKGLKMLYLGVFSTNTMAHQVYTNVGFKVTGRKPKIFFRDGKYIDDVIMTLDISLN